MPTGGRKLVPLMWLRSTFWCAPRAPGWKSFRSVSRHRKMVRRSRRCKRRRLAMILLPRTRHCTPPKRSLCRKANPQSQCRQQHPQTAPRSRHSALKTQTFIAKRSASPASSWMKSSFTIRQKLPRDGATKIYTTASKKISTKAAALFRSATATRSKARVRSPAKRVECWPK